MRYFIAGTLILTGVMALGVAYNNNGILLFRIWGQIYRDMQAHQPIPPDPAPLIAEDQAILAKEAHNPPHEGTSSAAG